MLTKTHGTEVLTKTMLGFAIAGAVLSFAMVGMTSIENHRREIDKYIASHFPYQTTGYVPGYVPGYIPGNVPGYSVPGYVPGYGTFKRLDSASWVKEYKLWVEKFRKSMGW